MEIIQKMKAGQYYMIESLASANSVYFETDALAKLFFRYCNYYLKDYLHVEEYVLNEHGWTMLVKVRSAQTIQKHYGVIESKRNSKGHTSNVIKPKEIWLILSERVRLFISTYVRMSNKIIGREGTLVRRKYGRYQFDNLEEAKDYVAKIRNNQHDIKQTQEKYRGFEEHFRITGNILTNPLRSSIWLELSTAKDTIQEKIEEIFGGQMPVMKELGNLVALKFVNHKSTLKSPPSKPPKL